MKKLLVLLTAVIMLFGLAACGGASENGSNPSDATETPSEQIKESIEETPEAKPEKTIKIQNYESFLYEGEEAVFTVDGEDKIVWTSSDTAVASVDSNGVVKAVGYGNAVITAALAEDESINAQVEIQIGVHVNSIALDVSEMTLLAGTIKGDAGLQVTVLPENATDNTVVIQSSDTDVVTVDNNGLVHAVAPGTATISVKANDESCEETAECTITVIQGVTAIEFAETEGALYNGEKTKLIPTIQPENAENKDVTWSSGNESIAKVASDGTITAVSAGQVDIICTAQDGGETTAIYKLNVVVGTKKLTLGQKTLTVVIGAGEEGALKQITYTLSPEDTTFTDIEWTSSDESVAVVDKNGVVKGISAGKATITAIPSDPRLGAKGKVSCVVTVGQAVTGLSINNAPEQLAKGKAVVLKTTVSPENAMNKKIAWTTSDKSVATVDAKGTLKAVGVGKATITATAQDGSGKSASFTVVVFQAVTSVKAKETGKIVLFAGQDKTLHVTVGPADATDKNVTWTSSDKSVAEVSSTGVVSAKRTGTAVITATANDGSGKKASFSVLVEPTVPITIKSLGFGIYNANLLGITVKNKCASTTIKNFDFNIILTDYAGNRLRTSGSYSLGKDETIGANAKKTIKRTLAGVSSSYKITITITGVKLANGTYYEIPYAAQETWTFTR